MAGKNPDKVPCGFGAEGVTGRVGRNGIHQKFYGSRRSDLLYMHDDTGQDFSGFSGQSISFFFFADSCGEGLDRNQGTDTDKETGREYILYDLFENWHRPT